MREKQFRPDRTSEQQKIILQGPVEKQARWVTTHWVQGERKNCSPRLEFKVIVVLNGRQREGLIHAEPKLSDTGDRFLNDIVIFRIIRETVNKQNQTEQVAE